MGGVCSTYEREERCIQDNVRERDHLEDPGIDERVMLNFRHRASCILGQAFHCSPENAFYIFNQQIYFII